MHVCFQNNTWERSLNHQQLAILIVENKQMIYLTVFGEMKVNQTLDAITRNSVDFNKAYTNIFSQRQIIIMS